MKRIDNTVISASAGTGKTFQLALRYIKLLLYGVDPEKIVALTFSRKAGREIFDRIMEMLIDWINNQSEYCKNTKDFDFPDYNRGKLLETLKNFLQSSHKVKIGTYDSFFISIARTFPFELGIGDNFQLIDEHQKEKAVNTALKSLMAKLRRLKSGDKDLKNFLESYKNATWGQELGVASKKIREFVDKAHEKYFELPDGKKWGLNIKVPKQLSSNDISSLNSQMNAFISTYSKKKQPNKFKTFLNEILTSDAYSVFGKDAGNIWQRIKSQGFFDLKPGEKFQLYKKPDMTLSPKSSDELGKLISYYCQLKIAGKSKISRGLFNVTKVYEEEYDKLVRSKGKLTFADVVRMLSMNSMGNGLKLSQNPDAADNMLYINYRLDSKFEHWLLDEFQDTSFSQWSVISNLIDEVIQDSEQNRSFFYVGDIKQAIYGWRGGDSELFPLVREYYRMAESSLTKSYRSDKAIIQAVNRVFSNPQLPSEIMEDCELKVLETALKRFNFKKHETVKDGEGYCEHVQLAKPEKDSDEKPEIDNIDNILKKKHLLQRNLSVAVLVNSNTHARKIAETLSAKGHKIALEGDLSINSNPLVRTFVSLITFIQHPSDGFAEWHLKMSPFAKYIPGDFTKCRKFCIDQQKLLYDKGFGDYFLFWKEKLESDGMDFSSFSKVFREFILASEKFDEINDEFNSLEFRDFIENYKVPVSAESGALQIMTIHKSKGLQFDVVFLPFPEYNKKRPLCKNSRKGVLLEKDKDSRPSFAMEMPGEREIAEQNSKLEKFLKKLDIDSCYENLCTLYVAMTRAKHALYISSFKSKEPSQTYSYDLLGGEFSEGNSQWFKADFKICEVCGKNSPGKPDLFSGSETSIKIKRKVPAFMKRDTPSGREKNKVSGRVLFAEKSGAELGSAVHEIFEKLSWIDETDIDLIRREWKENKSYSREIKQHALDTFNKSIEKKEIISILTKNNENLELWREKAFDVFLNGKWLSGIFDRVHIYRKNNKIVSADIFDYKTDYLKNPEETEQLISKYSPQMESYQSALSHILRIPEKNIKGRLIAVRFGKVLDCSKIQLL